MNIYTTAGVLVAASFGSFAMAGPVVDLAPGDSTGSLSGISNSVMPELIGTVEYANYQSFTIGSPEAGAGGQLYDAMLLSSMIRSNQTGNLTFNFRIYNPDAGLSGQISHIEITGFSGLQTRVEYRNEATSPGDEGPSMAERSIDGDMLTFGFGTSLETAESSKFFFTMLDISEFDFDNSSVQATIYLLSGEMCQK